MKICAAQLRPVAGDVEENIRRHCAFVERAAVHGANLIFFPELSITGYEPQLAKRLATNQDDPRFEILQALSDAKHIIIAVGMPTIAALGVRISMIAFQPNKARVTYSKQKLHVDEVPLFVHGDEQVVLEGGDHLLAPAICYESLQADHAQNAVRLGANIYLASVAKSSHGVAKAHAHYSAIARQHSMIVLMANCLGPCDDFVGAGHSAAWDRRGELVARIDHQREGIVMIDAATEEVNVFDFEP